MCNASNGWDAPIWHYSTNLATWRFISVILNTLWWVSGEHELSNSCASTPCTALNHGVSAEEVLRSGATASHNGNNLGGHAPSQAAFNGPQEWTGWTLSLVVGLHCVEVLGWSSCTYVIGYLKMLLDSGVGHYASGVRHWNLIVSLWSFNTVTSYQ